MTAEDVSTETASGTRVGDASYQPFQYAGEYTDPTPTAKQWLQARAYDPATMRFTSMDEEELHNRYAYTNLNPITMVDPTGRSGEWDHIVNFATFGLAIAGAIFGAVASIALTGGMTIPAWIGAGFALGDLGLITTEALRRAELITVDEKIFAYAGYAITAGTVLAGLTATAVGVGTALSRAAAAKKWNDAILLRDTAGEPIAFELTDLTDKQIVKAINSTVARTEFAGSVEFLYVHAAARKPRLVIGALTKQEAAASAYQASAKHGPFPPGTFPGGGVRYAPGKYGSNHENLARMAGISVPPTTRMTVAQVVASRGHVSGGVFTAAVKRKNGKDGYRVRAITNSGHFARDSPGAFWSGPVSTSFQGFLKDRGIRTKVYAHAEDNPERWAKEQVKLDRF